MALWHYSTSALRHYSTTTKSVVLPTSLMSFYFIYQLLVFFSIFNGQFLGPLSFVAQAFQMACLLLRSGSLSSNFYWNVNRRRLPFYLPCLCHTHNFTLLASLLTFSNNEVWWRGCAQKNGAAYVRGGAKSSICNKRWDVGWPHSHHI